VRIFILPDQDGMYMSSRLACLVAHKEAFTRFGAEKGLSDVALAAGKNKSSLQISRHGIIQYTQSQRLTVSTKFMA